MDIEKYSAGPCPVGRGLVMVGDAWSMLILRDAGFGLTRFDQFRRSLGIAPNILTRRLTALTKAGLLEKRNYRERPPRDAYLITEAGRDFLPILQVIGAWGRRHNGGGDLSHVVDTETGEAIDPVVIDRQTGAPIGTRPLRLVRPVAFVAPADADTQRQPAVPERPGSLRSSAPQSPKRPSRQQEDSP
jgi:DNA-binding HxlR family transcriptional regulator